jgi:hypothetical protein
VGNGKPKVHEISRAISKAQAQNFLGPFAKGVGFEKNGLLVTVERPDVDDRFVSSSGSSREKGTDLFFPINKSVTFFSNC